jgi:hypothetical protein
MVRDEDELPGGGGWRLSGMFQRPGRGGRRNCGGGPSLRGKRWAGISSSGVERKSKRRRQPASTPASRPVLADLFFSNADPSKALDIFSDQVGRDGLRLSEARKYCSNGDGTVAMTSRYGHSHAVLVPLLINSPFQSFSSEGRPPP